MKKLLFISHDASRTGAPIVLLNFLGWLKTQGGFEISVYLINGGELEDEFRKLGNTYLPTKKTLPQRLAKRIIGSKVAEEVITLPQALLNQTFSAVYLNTVVSLNLAPHIKSVYKCPVICHVHENDFTIKNYYPGAVITRNLQAVDKFIAVSESTKHNLIEKYGVAPTIIELVYEFISLEKITKPTISKNDALSELGLNKKEFIVGGSGLTIWRKGADIFVRLAVELNKLKPGNNIKLLWVGALTHEFNCQYNYEADRLGIASQIIFAGNKTLPQNYFQLFNVFALTSREDPFPLVAIEAASLNIPIVCFDNAGGIPEFIINGQNGITVPYADVKEMAVQILTLADNKELLQKIGTHAGKHTAQFDVDIICPQIVNIIDQLIIEGNA